LEWQKDIKIIPESEVKRLIDWINNIDQDWNISRTKMLWGLAFPFYEKDGKIYTVNIEDLPIDPRMDKEKVKKYNGNFFEDVTVDVWVASSITPLVILYYTLTENKEFDPKELPELFNKIKEYLPVDLRQQGYEIIRTWLFDTIVRVNLLTNKNPWKYALIHGMVLDEKGRKMSKSLGNAVDPNEIMDKYSPDALRYWALLAAPGNDYRFNMKDIEWRKYTWEDFANNYLEKIKERIKNDDKTAKYLLYTIYKIILIMLHPILPYITEYIYQQLYKENKLIIENKIDEIIELIL
jgi:valyl-tRNA synthetase